MPEISVSKINAEAALDKVCLLGCGITTGYGAVKNILKCEPGSSLAVWGLGCVGLGAVMAAKAGDMNPIIGIDLNEAKFEQAKEFGCTECINPKNHTEEPF